MKKKFNSSKKLICVIFKDKSENENEKILIQEGIEEKINENESLYSFSFESDPSFRSYQILLKIEEDNIYLTSNYLRSFILSK